MRIRVAYWMENVFVVIGQKGGRACPIKLVIPLNILKDKFGIVVETPYVRDPDGSSVYWPDEDIRLSWNQLEKLEKESQKPRTVFYVGYADDGPSGPCPQTVGCILNRKKLYIFYSWEDAQEFMGRVQLTKGRLRPRIVGFWEESEFSENVIRVEKE